MHTARRSIVTFSVCAGAITRGSKPLRKSAHYAACHEMVRLARRYEAVRSEEVATHGLDYAGT